MIAGDKALGMLGPALLIAVTLKVYEIPLVSPVTVIGLFIPLAVIFPGVDVTI
jgi:hypothetical protein